jgi:hypothetical protein
MTKIDDKHVALKRAGFDLGAALAPAGTSPSSSASSSAPPARRSCGCRSTPSSATTTTACPPTKGTDIGDMLTMFWKSVTDSFTEDERQARTGAPNQGGVGVGGGFDLVPAAIAAPGDGLVIIGMHAPPFSPPGGECPYYLRETQHPVADARQVPELLRRRKGESRGWIDTGTPHFKAGAVSDGLDYGTARSRGEEFVKMIAGGGGS